MKHEGTDTRRGHTHGGDINGTKVRPIRTKEPIQGEKYTQMRSIIHNY